MSALTLLGLYLLAGLILVVPAVGALFERRRYEALISERATQGDRLQSLIEAVEVVGERTGALQTRVGRIHLAYGLGAIDPTSRRRRAEPPAAPDSIYAGLVNRGRLEAESMAESLQGLGSLVEQIESHEEAHPERQRATPSISPLGRATFVMTSPFGSRVGVAWWRFGNLVALRHGEEFVTVFGHCDEVRVRRGERVRRGDLIATVGNSGWSTNPHLHYEVRRLDATGSYQPIDPRVFILDQSWRDEEQILIGATRAIDRREFESLPRSLRR